MSELDDLDRLVAVHEAGHAVVALALNAKVQCVRVDFENGSGGVDVESPVNDDLKDLAICVAGCRVERVEAPAPSTKQFAEYRQAKKCDFRRMRQILLRFPAAERREARRKGYTLADSLLNAHANAVREIADELIARRWKGGNAIACIEGDDLMTMFRGAK